MNNLHFGDLLTFSVIRSVTIRCTILQVRYIDLAIDFSSSNYFAK